MSEIINQFMDSKVLKEIVYKENNFELSKDNVEFASLYDEWQVVDGRLQSSRKKWVNNVLNEEYRPENYTDFDNLCYTFLYYQIYKSYSFYLIIPDN